LRQGVGSKFRPSKANEVKLFVFMVPVARRRFCDRSAESRFVSHFVAFGLGLALAPSFWDRAVNFHGLLRIFVQNCAWISSGKAFRETGQTKPIFDFFGQAHE
jgi:hypothetical protein